MEKNEIGNRFYQNYGFRKFNLHKDYYSKNNNAISYIKNIKF